MSDRPVGAGDITALLGEVAEAAEAFHLGYPHLEHDEHLADHVRRLIGAWFHPARDPAGSLKPARAPGLSATHRKQPLDRPRSGYPYVSV